MASILRAILLNRIINADLREFLDSGKAISKIKVGGCIPKNLDKLKRKRTPEQIQYAIEQRAKKKIERENKWREMEAKK